MVQDSATVVFLIWASFCQILTERIGFPGYKPGIQLSLITQSVRAL